MNGVTDIRSFGIFFDLFRLENHSLKQPQPSKPPSTTPHPPMSTYQRSTFSTRPMETYPPQYQYAPPQGYYAQPPVQQSRPFESNGQSFAALRKVIPDAKKDVKVLPADDPNVLAKKVLAPEPGIQYRCLCGIAARMGVSTQDKSNGRFYIGCPKPKGASDNCKTFFWFMDEVLQRVDEDTVKVVDYVPNKMLPYYVMQQQSMQPSFFPPSTSNTAALEARVKSLEDYLNMAFARISSLEGELKSVKSYVESLQVQVDEEEEEEKVPALKRTATKEMKGMDMK